ncbi:hypothetical protein GYMLUDRAFT_37181 [Collybiopsis luxurians FD-317 M1]|nr:hypothetical protein GYMLUDRAFT_37181 [Collybiopsis luxurians FD-317 M1]
MEDNLLSPINTLPVELLSEIFLTGQVEECFQNDEFDSDSEDNGSVDLPFEMRMSQVCSSWRFVAINTGQLWSDIFVGAGYSTTIASIYLKRSGECPLDVYLQNCPDTPTTNRVLEAIFQHSNRWSACTLEGDMDSLIISRIVALSVPNIKVFRCTVHPPMRTRRVGETWEGRQIFESEKGCPLLKMVCLYSFAVHFAFPPLSNVTKLRLDYTERLPLTYTRFRQILIDCRTLKNFSIRGEIVDSLPWPENTSPVLLPKLSTLHISSLSGQVYSGILLSIEAPVLRSLTLEGAQECDLDRFLTLGAPRKFPHLRSFALHGSSLTPSKLSELYAFFSSLDRMITGGLIFDPCQVIKAVAESISDLGLDLLRFERLSSTLGIILNATQRVLLEKILEERLVEEGVEFDYDGDWTFSQFFNWLQTFVTVEALLLAKKNLLMVRDHS